MLFQKSFQQRNMVKPGEGTNSQLGPAKTKTETASAPVGERWEKFISFLKGVEIWEGLTVNDFLAVYGFSSFQQGAEVAGGLSVSGGAAITEGATVTGGTTTDTLTASSYISTSDAIYIGGKDVAYSRKLVVVDDELKIYRHDGNDYVEQGGAGVLP